jgi:hypothetical protein
MYPGSPIPLLPSDLSSYIRQIAFVACTQRDGNATVRMSESSKPRSDIRYLASISTMSYPQITYPDTFNSKIAVFGSTGMIGNAIVKALLNPPVQGFKPTVYAFVSPSRPHDKVKNLKGDIHIVEVEYSKGGPELAEKLRGIDTVISALGGEGQKFQYAILDAAAEAGELTLDMASDADG